MWSKELMIWGLLLSKRIDVGYSCGMVFTRLMMNAPVQVTLSKDKCCSLGWCNNGVWNFCLYTPSYALKDFTIYFWKLIINHSDPTHSRPLQTQQLTDINIYLTPKWKFWKWTRPAKTWCVFVINDVPFHFSCLLLLLLRKHSTDKCKL